MVKLKHASLFSGIGAAELAAQHLGWENVFHCEINSFGQSILHHHFPNSVAHEDIKRTDFTIYRGLVDVLTGGFPCQPYSLAGLRKGTEDARHLWPEMLRAIREVQPRWIVGENVFGLINWNDGLVFEEIQTDLEAEGYEVQPYILPAAGIGAPHKRDRIWFIAYRSDAGTKGVRRERKDEIHESVLAADSSSNGHELRESGENRRTQSEGESIRDQWERLWCDAGGIGEQGITANTNNHGSHGPEVGRSNGKGNDNNTERPIQSVQPAGRSVSSTRTIDTDTNGAGSQKLSWFELSFILRKAKSFQREKSGGTFTAENAWESFPTQPPVHNRYDGLPSEALRRRLREDSNGHLSEKEINKILSTAAIEWRTEAIKAAGNAIVPQLILQIFKTIIAYENVCRQPEDLSKAK